VALTELGTLQCKALAARLRSASYYPHLILSSTAVRAISTTSAVLPSHCHFTTTPHLLEQSQGDWTGQPRAGVYTSDVVDEMRRLHVDFSAPHGESIRQAGERAMRSIWNEVERYRGERKDGGEKVEDALDVLVVTHGMVIRALVFLLCGLRGEVVWRVGCDNCSMTEVMVDSRGVRLIRLNDHSHTDGLTDLIDDR
jgi:broad specificity phosphatase PhoE